MEKALSLKGAMIKGRPVVIKKSNRNITKSNSSKKRKREEEGEKNYEQENIEEKQKDYNKKTKKLTKEIKEFENQEKYEEFNYATVSVKREDFIQNRNDSYVPKKENEEKKAKMKNTDFKKFLNK